MEKFALNVRNEKNDFLYQIDCFDTYKAVKDYEAKSKLNNNEYYEIVKIEYDKCGNEISCYIFE